MYDGVDVKEKIFFQFSISNSFLFFSFHPYFSGAFCVSFRSGPAVRYRYGTLVITYGSISGS